MLLSGVKRVKGFDVKRRLNKSDVTQFNRLFTSHTSPFYITDITDITDITKGDVSDVSDVSDVRPYPDTYTLFTLFTIPLSGVRRGLTPPTNTKKCQGVRGLTP